MLAETDALPTYRGFGLPNLSTADVGAASVYPEAFKAGMRRLAGAVCIITSRHVGDPVALVATALCSLSADPPSLVACVNRTANAYPSITSSGGFCVNVLAASQMSIARMVAAPELRDKRFTVGSWQELPTGGLALDGALTSFDCAVGQCVDVKTHSILIGLIRHVRLGPEQPPLLYMDGQYLAETDQRHC